jgi:hypothetical protein
MTNTFQFSTLDTNQFRNHQPDTIHGNIDDVMESSLQTKKITMMGSEESSIL